MTCRRPEQHPSAWCNDTLCGRLLDWVRPEDHEGEDPPYGKFGFWRSVERRMIREEFRAEHGRDPDYLEEGQRITANHARDPSFRELQESDRVRAGATARPARRELSRDALERLQEHFAGANDPVAQEILAWATSG